MSAAFISLGIGASQEMMRPREGTQHYVLHGALSRREQATLPSPTNTATAATQHGPSLLTRDHWLLPLHRELTVRVHGVVTPHDHLERPR